MGCLGMGVEWQRNCGNATREVKMIREEEELGFAEESERGAKLSGVTEKSTAIIRSTVKRRVSSTKQLRS